ncbi:N-formylglutamate amidohydrolase [Tatumella terrea]|uniref:N-formylglutamate amidohydrolase n=1 Tax=Tatumella terrea TaxID=419007 RepID=UPI0031D0B996
MSDKLLSPDEPAPFTVRNREGTSPFLLICDHAGKRIPRRLGTLGLSPAEIDRHIGWDIGALPVAEQLSELLDATLISQTWSRLVIDCNRPPSVVSSIPLVSEATDIPGNQGLSAAQKLARQQEIFTPYHDEIRRLLTQRRQCGQATCIISVHSFTPVYLDIPRPWHIGLLYHRLKAYPQAFLSQLQAQHRWEVGDNQPYSVSDETDYAIPQHADKNGYPSVGIEIRQDLIAEAEGQTAWAKALAPLLQAAWQNYRTEHDGLSA